MILLKAPTNAKTAGQQTSVVGGVLNFFLAIIQLIVGLLSGSAALTADSFHTLADLGSDIVTYLAVSISRKDADETHQYGHGKFESVGLIVLSVFLTIAAIGISVQALERFFAGTLSTLGPLPLFVAFATLLAKEGMFRYTKYWGDKFKSKVIVMNAWHHRSDGISSAIVFFSIALNMAGLQFFDTLAALSITFMLLRMSWKNGREAFNELVDASVEEEALQQIKTVILETAGVRSCHYLRARRMGGDIYLDVHIEVLPYISVSEGHAISDYVEERLTTLIEDVADVIVHVDPYPDENVKYVNHPQRSVLEEKVAAALKTEAPKIALAHLVLHTLPKELSAEIVVADDLSNAQIERLKKALMLPQGPFNTINFLKKLS